MSRAAHFADGDAFYAALAEALDARSPAEALDFLARLALILANEVGEAERLDAALALAEGLADVQSEPGSPPSVRA